MKQTAQLTVTSSLWTQFDIGDGYWLWLRYEDPKPGSIGCGMALAAITKGNVPQTTSGQYGTNSDDWVRFSINGAWDLHLSSKRYCAVAFIYPSQLKQVVDFIEKEKYGAV